MSDNTLTTLMGHVPSRSVHVVFFLTGCPELSTLDVSYFLKIWTLLSRVLSVVIHHPLAYPRCPYQQRQAIMRQMMALRLV